MTKKSHLFPYQKNTNTNGFDKRPQDAGLPKLKIRSIVADLGYTAADLRVVFGDVSWLDEAKLTELANDLKQPIIVRIVSKAFLAAAKEGDFFKVMSLVEQAIGKPKQQTEMTLSVPPPTVIVETPEQKDNLDKLGDL